MYEICKIVHILSIISWMAGLLYLPRLLVNHAVATKGSEISEKFKGMEQRLLKIIMTPAMISSWVFGLLLAYFLDSWFDIWFLLKLVLVVAMTVFHFILASWVRDFATDSNKRPHRFYRIANEIPTILMILIVIIVIIKPF